MDTEVLFLGSASQKRIIFSGKALRLGTYHISVILAPWRLGATTSFPRSCRYSSVPCAPSRMHRGQQTSILVSSIRSTPVLIVPYSSNAPHCISVPQHDRLPRSSSSFGPKGTTHTRSSAPPPGSAIIIEARQVDLYQVSRRHCPLRPSHCAGSFSQCYP